MPAEAQVSRVAKMLPVPSAPFHRSAQPYQVIRFDGARARRISALGREVLQLQRPRAAFFAERST